MKKNILMRTNFLICTIIAMGFLLTAALSYRANFSASLESIEQVSGLTSEGIFYQMNTTFSKPINISLTMANDSLLCDVLSREPAQPDAAYNEIIREYLNTYQTKYGYDAVFLVSAASARYYNFNGLDRVLDPDDPENVWYFDGLLGSDTAYTMNVDNDQVEGAENAITVFVNCKIWDSSGTLLGVVGVGVRINGLQRTLQTYRDQFGVSAYLLDDTGTIELSSEYSGYENINLFTLNTAHSEETRRNILDWKEDGEALSFWALDSAGQKCDYIVARYLPAIRWHLVVVRDTGVMMNALHCQFLVTVAVIVGILAGILLIITKVIRRFNRQIVELTQAVEQERQVIFEQATEKLFENIYEIDVTHNLPANPAAEAYFESLGAPSGCSYEAALHIIAEKQIKEEFRQGYIDTFSPPSVLAAYAAGTLGLTYEFMITKDGRHYYWMRITARLVQWETDGSIHMLVYRQNIDAEKHRENRMQTLARTDEMTGFLTKTAAQRRVGELLAASPAATFVYFIFDIDNFKQANDQFGHAFGDAVICTFSQTIRAHFREDDVLGRIGGDEFMVFARGPGHDWAAKKAEALRQALFYTQAWSGMRWQVSASMGVAFAPEQGTDADTLYKNADAALYQTKARGKNSFTLCGEADHPPKEGPGATCENPHRRPTSY